MKNFHLDAVTSHVSVSISKVFEIHKTNMKAYCEWRQWVGCYSSGNNLTSVINWLFTVLQPHTVFFLPLLSTQKKDKQHLEKAVRLKKNEVKQSGSIQSIRSTVEEGFCSGTRLSNYVSFFITSVDLLTCWTTVKEPWIALALFSHYSGDYGNGLVCVCAIHKDSVSVSVCVRACVCVKECEK